MRKFTILTALSLLALTACGHGGHNALPSSAGGTMPDTYLHQKMAAEQQRVPSTFVAPKHPGYIAETPSTQVWASGITQAGEAPVPGGMFDITNQYNTTMNGRHVTVYAGSLKTTGAGILLVVTRSADLHTVNAQTYTVASGPVRIQSAADGQLQLQTLGAAHQNVPFRLPM